MVGIYHSRDLDGYACGAIIKKKYPEATLIGFDYGQGLQKLLDLISRDDEVIMADVSLPKSEEFFADPNKQKQADAWIATAKRAIDWTSGK